ncbi:MAG TPA: hypothetical protein VGO60_16855 [Iamia sp.]|jgi:hypothetical protein|nr:hypothetical protein [Iamia sp.]
MMVAVVRGRGGEDGFQILLSLREVDTGSSSEIGLLGHGVVLEPGAGADDDRANLDQGLTTDVVGRAERRVGVGADAVPEAVSGEVLPHSSTRRCQ